MTFNSYSAAHQLYLNKTGKQQWEDTDQRGIHNLSACLTVANKTQKWPNMGGLLRNIVAWKFYHPKCNDKQQWHPGFPNEAHEALHKLSRHFMELFSLNIIPYTLGVCNLQEWFMFNHRAALCCKKPRDSELSLTCIISSEASLAATAWPALERFSRQRAAQRPLSRSIFGTGLLGNH